MAEPEGWPAGLPPLASLATTPAELAAELGAGLQRLRQVAGWEARPPAEPSMFDVLHERVCELYLLDQTFPSWWEALNWAGETFRAFRIEHKMDASGIAELLTMGRLSAADDPARRAGAADHVLLQVDLRRSDQPGCRFPRGEAQGVGDGFAGAWAGEKLAAVLPDRTALQLAGHVWTAHGGLSFTAPARLRNDRQAGRLLDAAGAGGRASRLLVDRPLVRTRPGARNRPLSGGIALTDGATVAGVDECWRIAMFAASEGMFMYVESSLRVGGGEDRREVDLPLQREVATGYPLLPGSTLKGVLRSRARSLEVPAELLDLLGSGPEADDRQPSSVVVSDAIPLLFPVRSLTGLFAWVTSLDLWARFRRDLATYGVKLAEPPAAAGAGPRDGGRGPRVAPDRQQANAGTRGAQLPDPGGRRGR